MRRGLVSLCLLLVLAAGAYAIYPLWSAWKLKTAVASGDVETVRTSVVWESVRQTLRRSIATHAELDPIVANFGDLARRPTLWRRIKRAFGYRMLDQFIANYITPTGLIKLHRMRARRRRPGMLRTRYAMRLGVPQKPTHEAVGMRVLAFLKRLRRIAFVSPTQVAIEFADQYRPDRHYVLRFGLRDWRWLLTGIEVVRPKAVPHAAAATH